MIFQDPMTSLNPVLTIGKQIREALQTHFDIWTARRPTCAAIELLDQVGIPSAKARLERLPAPVLRRHAPAGDDRDGPRLRAEAPDRRRADDRARRDDPGADPRSAARRSSRARHRADPDHARSRRRRRDVRARERDVRRARSSRPARPDHVFAHPRHPYTLGPAAERPAPRHRAGSTRCTRSPGQPRNMLSPPSVVPVRAALPLRAPRCCDERAARARARWTTASKAACFNPVDGGRVAARHGRRKSVGDGARSDRRHRSSSSTTSACGSRSRAASSSTGTSAT